MNLALDFGNTRIKAGIFNGNELLESHVFDSPQQLLNSLDLFATVKHCILGSVTKDHEGLISLLPSSIKTIMFKPDLKIPIKNLYKSALTLGSDRLAASIGSWLLYPDKNTLTIDAGTCIKYNFVNSQNEYLGGAISPGLQMRLNAMHHYTHALPLVEADHSYDKLVGNTSKESLLAGALLGAACETDDMILRYSNIYEDLHVILTGGDGVHLSARLKSRFFAHQNILLSGLNHILQLNIEK